MEGRDSYQELQNRLELLEADFKRYKEKNEALKETKKRFYSLSNRTHDGIYTLNLSINKYVYTNPAFIKMFGHTCKDIVTTESVMEHILAVDRLKLRKKIEASLNNSGEGDEIEYRCIDHDGRILWMHDRWVILRDEKGNPTAIEGIVRDITEMKDVISLKNYLESIFESCMDAIIVANEKGIITLANRAAESLLHINSNAMVGSFIGDIIKGESGRGQSMYELILEHSPTANYELEARLQDGSVVPLLISSAFLKNTKNQMMGTISYIRDISIRKEAEERIRTLTQQLIRAQEVERSSIARDLHDHLAQNLYSFNIQLATFLKELPLSNNAPGIQSKALSDMLQEIIADVRKMVFNIHPTSLETLGLVNTINNLCRNVSQIYSLPINIKTAGMESMSLNFDVNITIYRLVQEALSNIVKHAHAGEVVIRLVYSYPKIILRIEDNGAGFDVESRLKSAGQKGCMGLWSMKERVALLDGEMTIHSQENLGTRIGIEIPYYEK